MNLYSLFQEVVKEQKNSIAIVDEKDKSSTSFARLQDEVDAFSSQLHFLGIKKDDKILILESMSHKLYVALISIFKLGAVAVFVDPSQDAKFVNHACNMAKPKALICSRKALLLKLKFKAIANIPLSITTKKLIFIECMNLNFLKKDIDYEVDSSNDALMSFTSGSTSKPKAIVRTHKFLFTQYKLLDIYIKLEKNQIDLTALPVFLLANLLKGLTSVIADVSLQHPKKIDPNKLLNSMVKHRVSRVGASPALFEQLLKSKDANLPYVKDFFMGGAPVMPSLLEKLHKRFDHINLYVLYGSSEAEPIAHYSYDQLSKEIIEKMLDGKGLYVGDVVPQINIDFLEDAEIIVSGEHVVQTYYNGVGDKENKLLKDGVIWHKTGDIGYLDKNKKLWLLGRKNAIIKKGTLTLHPFSIEVAMREKTSKMAALVEHKGEVVLCSEAKKHDISFEGVDKIVYIKHIPLDKRHNAKVDYTKLLEVL